VNVSARVGYAIPFNTIGDYDLGPAVCTTSENCTLSAIDEDFTLPLTERYFVGGLGAYQLRGFKARSVGPRRSILYDTSFAFSANKAGRYSPVGSAFNPNTGQTECTDGGFFGDGTPNFTNTQGNNDGKCNSLTDRQIDEFADLDETDVIGGNQFITMSAEYRFPIAESLGLVGIIFFDMGNAFAEDDFIFDVTEWRFGTGVGVLWFSPFGPLEAFVGFPLDKLSVEDSVVFEFSVGGSAL
jgi:outer membrane protein assembly factor BamA